MHLCCYIHLKSDYYSTMLFPGKLFCFKSNRKLKQQAVSTFQHYWKWRGGGGWRVELNNLEKVWGVAYYLFYISWYYKSIFLYQEINSISSYHNFIYWFKEIHFLISKNPFLITRNWIDFFYIKKSDWLFYIIDYIKKWIFLYQKSIFDITKYRMNRKTAPQRAVLLFIQYFF